MKTKVAVMFGGKSVEHEVSVISGIQALMSMDTEKYDCIPVYISKENYFYIGEDCGRIEAYRDLKALIAKSRRVIFVNEGEDVFLMPYETKRFGRKPEKIRIDVAFPVVHGTNEEDGALQGYLKTLGLPFVGPDVTSAAVGMDKYIQKMILMDNGVPVLDCLRFFLSDYSDAAAIVRRVEEKLGYPVIVKPVNLGSSVGIGIARNGEELLRRIDDAFLYAEVIMVEHAISELREINCSVLGDTDHAEASECEEPLHTKDILSYEDKYMSGGGKSGSKSGGTKSQGMASVSRKIPADLTPEMREYVREMAVRAFRALGCCGVARIDFMIDGETGKLWFNEINTIPGSLAFYLWEPLGVPYKELLDRMIRLAFKRQRTEDSLTFTFDTNILANASLGGSKGSKTKPQQ